MRINTVTPQTHHDGSLSWVTNYLNIYAILKAFHRSAIILLEDDAVADGGQQIVEVELVVVVGRIPAALLPRLHQSFSKPGIWGSDGERTWKPTRACYTHNPSPKSYTCAHLFRRFSISYSPICIVWSRRGSPIIRATRAFSSSIYHRPTNTTAWNNMTWKREIKAIRVQYYSKQWPPWVQTSWPLEIFFWSLPSVCGQTSPKGLCSVRHVYLCDDCGQAGLVETFMVCIGLLVSLPVLQLHL